MDCPKKLVDDHHELINIWSRWKRFGLYNGPTYPDDPALYITVIEILDSEYGRLGQHG
jgi:hypothetical protein